MLLFFSKSDRIKIGKNLVYNKYTIIGGLNMSNTNALSARDRITALVDENSFVEIGANKIGRAHV